LLRKISDNTHIGRLHEVYESATNVHLVLERVDGGELFDFIRNAGQLTEPQAALVIRGILTGLSVLHD
jgi:serine/threonine protein kinase